MKQTINAKTILAETMILTESTVTVSDVKRMDPEEIVKLADGFSTNALKMINKIIFREKNSKKIMATKGDFKAHEDYEHVFKIIDKLNKLEYKATNVPADYKEALVKINAIHEMLISSKYKNKFKKAFSDNNTLVSGFYTSIALSLILAVQKTFATYVEVDNVANISLIEKDKKLNNSKLFKELEKLIQLERNSGFGVIFDYQPEILEESSTVDVLMNILSSNKKTIAVAATFTIILTAITFTRYIVSKVLSIRQDISDYLINTSAILDEQLITLNDPKKRDRQEKWSERFKKLADSIEINDTVSDSGSDRILRQLDEATVKEYDSNTVRSTGFGF